MTLIVVVGPTASGKSQAAITLAQRYHGEIVSADSMQVYRYFDIGTGKITPEETQGIPHHLLDIVMPDDPYDAARFQKDADLAIQGIHSRQRTAIVVGGTGLYIRALLHGLFDLPSEPELRQHLHEQVDTLGLATMYQQLQVVDPIAAQRISANDKIRIIRALEVFQLSGRTFSSWATEHGHREERYPVLTVGIEPERSIRVERIEARIDLMLQMGWIAEVECLRSRGYSSSLKPMQAIGYREINAMLDGTLNPTDLRQQIGKSTRTYAKRQLTWFRKESVRWYETPQALLDDPELAKTMESIETTNQKR